MQLYFTVYSHITYFNADIDECSEYSDNCNQTCTNTEGSFTCGCDDGYLLDSDETTCNGTYCEIMIKQQKSTCISEPKICTCMQLYFTVYSHITYFNADIDECGEDSDNCNQTCTNTEGSFTCGCDDGYLLDSDGTTCNGTYCEIMIKQQKSTCISEPKICTCMQLYFTVYSHITYFNADIDECGEDSDNCNQTCTNTEGSFTCECNDGYLLDSDGTTCNGTYCEIIQYSLFL